MPMPKGEGFTNSIHPSPIPFQLSVRKVSAKKTHEPFGQLNVRPNMHHALQNPMKDLLKLAMVLGYY
jgi:hypothetical protein